VTTGFDGEDRSFYSSLLLAFAPFAIAGGWLFLVAGTGMYLAVAGLAMAVAGVLLQPSWPRAAAAVAGLVAGCVPFWALLAWIALG
jgi:hypothetical protein